MDMEKTTEQYEISEIFSELGWDINEIMNVEIIYNEHTKESP